MCEIFSVRLWSNMLLWKYTGIVDVVQTEIEDDDVITRWLQHDGRQKQIQTLKTILRVESTSVRMIPRSMLDLIVGTKHFSHPWSVTMKTKREWQSDVVSLCIKIRITQPRSGPFALSEWPKEAWNRVNFPHKLDRWCHIRNRRGQRAMKLRITNVIKTCSFFVIVFLHSHSLRRRGNSILVSNVCEAVPMLFFWAPNGAR